MTIPDITTRPRPVRAAAFDASKVVAGLTAIASAAVMVGLLSSIQANAITVALGGVVVVIGAVGPIVAAFRVSTTSEPLVTPVASPQDNAGNPLVPLAPSPFEAPQVDAQCAAGSTRLAAQSGPVPLAPPGTAQGNGSSPA